MKIVYFTHSLVSCWNHGNAHFLRGLLRELGALGHDVTACEPADAWSRSNLAADHGEAPIARASQAVRGIRLCTYDDVSDLAALIDGADAVIVHEWTSSAVVARIGAARCRSGQFRLFFHDTHHRAVSDPAAIRAFDLEHYDAILAFGESLAEVYRAHGWNGRTFVLHEAADTRLFLPPAANLDLKRDGLVWVGNWGDGERSAELEEFLLRPAEEAGLSLDIHGVRYPDEAQQTVARFGARYRGWLANLDVPKVFARHLATVHVPRRFYSTLLPGIPTIRVFEALACGIPLVCAPWSDTENLFRPGSDYLTVRSGREMRDALVAVASDTALARSLAKSGLETIRDRHTCAHRAKTLLDIVRSLAPFTLRGAA